MLDFIAAKIDKMIKDWSFVLKKHVAPVAKKMIPEKKIVANVPRPAVSVPQKKYATVATSTSTADEMSVTAPSQIFTSTPYYSFAYYVEKAIREGKVQMLVDYVDHENTENVEQVRIIQLILAKHGIHIKGKRFEEYYNSSDLSKYQ